MLSVRRAGWAKLDDHRGLHGLPESLYGLGVGQIEPAGFVARQADRVGEVGADDAAKMGQGWVPGQSLTHVAR